MTSKTDDLWPDDVEMAAAEAVEEVAALLERLETASGMSRREISACMGVTDGRVSQLFGAEGNIKVSTLGRLIRAMGFELEVDAVDATTRERLPVRHSRSARRGRVDKQPAYQLPDVAHMALNEDQIGPVREVDSHVVNLIISATSLGGSFAADDAFLVLSSGAHREVDSLWSDVPWGDVVTPAQWFRPRRRRVVVRAGDEDHPASPEEIYGGEAAR